MEVPEAKSYKMGVHDLMCVNLGVLYTKNSSLKKLILHAKPHLSAVES